MEFEDFVTFDDEIAVCGELTEYDILESVQTAKIQDNQMTRVRAKATVSDIKGHFICVYISVLKCFFEKKVSMSEFNQ